jgi:CRP-like cAMP-binding protein
MAKDGRALREEAAAAIAAGKHKRALAAYLELERMESRDAQWAKRAGETYRRLGNNSKAIEAFERSAERYAQNGFLVQAIAVCKVILQIDPRHADTLRRLAEMNEQIGASQTRAATMAENNPALHENPNVAVIRQGRSGNTPSQQSYDPNAPAPRARADEAFAIQRHFTPPVVAVARTKSRPIALPYGAALDTVDLRTQIPTSHVMEGGDPGIYVIPIDEEDFEQHTTNVDTQLVPREPAGNVHYLPDEGIDIDPEAGHDIDIEATELDLSDIEEIPLAQPRAIGSAAARALAATPLFAGMPSDALQALVNNLQLISLDRGEVLFHENDVSDALYVIAEGEVAVQTEGPPRAESRLGAGGFLGEVALMTDQPRSATVVCTQAAELLRIDRHTLARVLANHGDVLRAVLRFVRDRLVDRWMRTSPLFRPFNDAQRLELAAKFKFLEIDGGTVVLGAGSRPDGLYIVLAGQFLVLRNGSAVAQLGPGDLIGETALLSGGVFKSDVVARGKGLALCLPAQVFREVIMTHPHVLEYIGEHAEHSRRLQIL